MTALKERQAVSERTPAVCSACQAPLDLPYLCQACGELLRPPPGMDPFERLGLPRAFALDPAELERRYLDLSRRLHPDRMVGKPQATQTRALVLSAGLNEAYRVLKDELRRADCLITLLGGPNAEQERGADPEFLMRQIELREALDAAHEQGDRAALRRLLGEVEPAGAACLERIRAGFAAPDHRSPEALRRLRRELNTSTYWTNLAAQLREALA